MKNTKRLGLIILPFFALGCFILLTNPRSLPLPMLLIPSSLLGVGSYNLSKELLYASSVSVGKARFIAGALTAILLLGVLLQSIRQLTGKDFLILSILIVGVTLYMRRLDI